MNTKSKTLPQAKTQNGSEIDELRERLALAENTLEAIRNGEVDGLVVSTREGDQIFTLQGAEKPYRLLMEAMNEGALTIVPDGTILFCNASFARMLGTPMERIVGASFSRFLPKEQQGPFQNLLQTAAEMGSKGQFDLLHPNQPLHVQLSLTRMELDGVVTVAIVATDLSERLANEDALRRQNAELESRVAARTRDLTDSNSALRIAQGKLRREAQDLENEVGVRTQELQQTVRSLEDLCYSIAHDLRAPLRAMKGFSGALRDEFGHLLPDVGKDYADRVASAAVRMDQLITDLLAYGRLNSGDLPLIDLDPLPLLEQFVRNTASGAKIEIQKPILKVLGNPTALKQILDNLLVNAMKFVPPGVTPEISVTSTERSGWVRLTVQDNGIGIDPQYHERIFRVFERLSARDYPGTGIGLAIVQKGAERMGGRVGVESEPGKGSRFWLELRKP